MITCKEFPSKTFRDKEEMFKALRKNKETLIAQKKMITKEADAVVYVYRAKDSEGNVIKD